MGTSKKRAEPRQSTTLHSFFNSSPAASRDEGLKVRGDANTPSKTRTKARRQGSGHGLGLTVDDAILVEDEGEEDPEAELETGKEAAKEDLTFGTPLFLSSDAEDDPSESTTAEVNRTVSSSSNKSIVRAISSRTRSLQKTPTSGNSAPVIPISSDVESEDEPEMLPPTLDKTTSDVTGPTDSGRRTPGGCVAPPIIPLSSDAEDSEDDIQILDPPPGISKASSSSSRRNSPPPIDIDSSSLPDEFDTTIKLYDDEWFDGDDEVVEDNGDGYADEDPSTDAGGPEQMRDEVKTSTTFACEKACPLCGMSIEGMSSLVRIEVFFYKV